MNSFPKIEKLCREADIESLYASGKRFTCWPLRITYITKESSLSAPQVLIWAPKSLFKHAVDRNRLRRLMREAWRLNKGPLSEAHMLIAFNYIDKELQPYEVVERAMIKAVDKLSKTLQD